MYDVLAHVPQYDFSLLGDMSKFYQVGQEVNRQDAMRSAFSGGLPRTASGEIDWGRALDIAGQTGNLGSLSALGQTVPFAGILEKRQAEAQALAASKAFQDAVRGAGGGGVVPSLVPSPAGAGGAGAG